MGIFQLKIVFQIIEPKNHKTLFILITLKWPILKFYLINYTLSYHQVELMEEAFRRNFENNIKPNLISINIDGEKANLNEFFRSPHISHESLENLQQTYTEMLTQLEKNMCNFNLHEYDLRRNKFLSETDISSPKLGSLLFFRDFLKNEPLQNVVTADFNTIHIYNLNTNSVIKSLHGHDKEVECLALYENTKLVSSSRDKTIKIWSLVTGKCLHTLNGHSSVVVCLKVSERRQCLFSGSIDKSIKMWSLLNGECLFTLTGNNHFFLNFTIGSSF